MGEAEEESGSGGRGKVKGGRDRRYEMESFRRTLLITNDFF